MKQPIQAFAIGLFVAGVLMLAGNYVYPAPQDTVNSASIEELIKIVEDEGYHVLTESEYITYSVQKDAHGQSAEATDNQSEPGKNDGSTDQPDTNDKTEESSEPEKDDKNTGEPITLAIEPGMASSDVSFMLEKEGIVEDSKEFNTYLNKHDFSPYIQIGDVEVSSNMSFYEIAVKITQ
ncbi:hypothetical protein ACFOGI_02220 [Virgibacillus xinjiangensis]|uniref:YceG-like family protein n=1 Tax=Virgibacillus xinjiangensis TaxID=393090 RepID=A0ABV7CS82_9BACI